jgi:ribosomal protein S18 acetylase RimI-like enzyme
VEDRGQDGPGLNVREGTAHDHPFVVSLGASAFARFGEYASIMEEFLACPDVTPFIAEAAGARVGFALVQASAEHRGLCDLVAIAVDEDRRRTGVGRALLSRVIAFAEERHEPALIVLTVADDNAAAIRLFRAHGFGMLPGSSGLYAGGQISRRMARTVDSRHEPAR